MKLTASLAASALAFILGVACATSGGEPAPIPSVRDAPPQEPAVRPDRVPLVEGPVSADGLKAILGTADLGVGPNRIGFVLTSPDGIVTAPVATVSSTYFPNADAEGQLKETAEAEFQPWPYGSRGLYTAWLDLDSAGHWGLDIVVAGPDGSPQRAEISFEVALSTSAPAQGAPAPKSRNKTLADVESVVDLSTGSLQDPDIYQTTIADAVASGMPTVVVFASPAFCTNAVCGPQVEVLQQLKDKYKGRANFIHVDFYDNPTEIQGDLDSARISPIVLEWGLPSIEWTFVIDTKGVVAARFEAFATFEELEEQLLQLL